MVMVKMLPQSEVCIFDNGKSYVFDNIGSCIREDSNEIHKYGSGSLRLPVVSVLSSAGKAEIATFNVDGEMKVYSFEGSSYDTVYAFHVFQTKGFGLLRVLTRSGKQNLNGVNVRYSQMIFVFREGANVKELLNRLNLKEVKGD